MRVFIGIMRSSHLGTALAWVQAMLHTVRSLVYVVLVVAAAAGCGSGQTPTGPSAGASASTPPTGGAAATATAPEQVSGTWILAAIQPAGQAEVTVPGGAIYELALADGRVSTRVDCNVCGGNLAVGSRTMTVGPLLACTRAACPTMAFESAYLAILAGESDTRIDGDTLTLTSTRGALRFRR